ncbi:MAG TPA: hypothetical protein VGU72_09700 [Beijerinckiaceae bacterium]|jgi:methenyltetrahydromethanopterin cyclohydrolase|nr:hypothetical protein [Beijerinckiaceae bacterium]
MNLSADMKAAGATVIARYVSAAAGIDAGKVAGEVYLAMVATLAKAQQATDEQITIGGQSLETADRAQLIAIIKTLLPAVQEAVSLVALVHELSQKKA